MSDMLAAMSDRAGALLQRAREARGLSVEDVAQAIKLQPRQVRAIEADDFDSLGGATFVRGFVRNYARYLQLDIPSVLAVLEEQTALPEAELHEMANVGTSMPVEGARRPIMWVGALLPLLLVAAGAAVYYLGLVDLDRLRPGAKPTAAQKSTADKVAQSAAEQPVAAGTQGEAASAAGAPAAPTASPAPAPVVNSALGPTGGAHKLIFKFERDSWVEVKDAGGRTILSQINPAGSTQTVEGKPPFAVVIGSASSVQLRYDNRDIDLRPHSKVDVARLTLE